MYYGINDCSIVFFHLYPDLGFALRFKADTEWFHLYWRICELVVGMGEKCVLIYFTSGHLSLIKEITMEI